MAASFQQLMKLLRSFEQEQFEILCSLHPNGITGEVAHSGVQFVSIEPGKRTTRAKFKSCSEEWVVDDDRELPVVIGIGINYCQDTSIPATFPRLVRYLRDQKNGQPTIIDHFPQMRSALDKTIAVYHRNKPAWTMSLPSGNAHACDVPPELEAGSDYILIATNFCPFITRKEWGEHSRQERQGLLDATDELGHLSSLATLIGGYADLWIGHGKEACWRPFDQLRQEMRAEIRHWMLTYNLSGRMCACIANARRGGNPLYQ